MLSRKGNRYVLVPEAKQSLNSLAPLEGHITQREAAREAFRNIQRALRVHFGFNVPYLELVIP